MIKIKLHRAALEFGEFSDRLGESQEYYYIMCEDAKDLHHQKMPQISKLGQLKILINETQ